MELEHIGSILERVLWDIACKTPEGPAMFEKYVLPQLQRAREEQERERTETDGDQADENDGFHNGA